MKFTYSAYRDMLSLLRNDGYAFCDYHNYISAQRCVILRHDIDESVEMALPIAALEAEFGVRSTYFVLLRSDLYNPASAKNFSSLQKLQALGHEIGLHYDEAAYAPCTPSQTVEHIIKECGLLATLLDTAVSSVSMHRPSKSTLEANLVIPGVVNSYSSVFFHDFKYLSDSRRHWREPVLDIISSRKYDRLHILTHAFWYHDQDIPIERTVGDFIQNANRERYAQMSENISNLTSIYGKGELLHDTHF